MTRKGKVTNQKGHKDFFDLGPKPSYTGRNLDEISFPLGGIGTGSVGLGGWGQLKDWEMMNRPAKGFVVPRAFFTLKASVDNEPPVIRVLQGQVGGSYVGDGHSLVPSHRELQYERNDVGQGLPHFLNATFTGSFPFARIVFEDPEVPLRVSLEAFNPLIPLNDKDSSIPVAILSYSFKNTSDKEVAATVYGNLTNIIGGAEGRENEGRKQNAVTGLHLTNTELEARSPSHGSMTLATTWPDAVVWPRWKDKRLSKFWEAVTEPEHFPPEGDGGTGTGTVAANFSVKPQGTITVTFILAWHFPTFKRYWGRTKENQEPAAWKNYYATLWKDSWDVVTYTSSNLSRLLTDTRLFSDTLSSSTFPAHVLDAVSSQISTLKTTTCLRLEDGTFYGFEGSSNTNGCCEGSCTHVWNYAQALPYLFPRLQRSMLEAHFANSVEEDGFMTFRMPLPLGTRAEPTFHPAADGQMGTVLQVYREWLVSGDDEWLRSVWPAAKKLLEFSWKYWDADKDGVMEGMQHNTYDIEFYGPNTMMGSLYLAALRAGEEIAEYLGEHGKAKELRTLFEKGSRWSDNNLFNGEYYEQKVNSSAHETWPEHYRNLALRRGKDDKFKEWPKWQFGKGCLSDQMIGQWYSHMLGLGYLYNPSSVRETLQSIFKYNWKPNLRNHPCFLRIYAINDEAGLLICTWPKGERPGYAFYFADEVWCGIEYQVASHMIFEGMVDEGLAIVKGTRNRHRGDRRNPWDEFECGHHYARSMASYALLLALSGFSYCASRGTLGFSPRFNQGDFKSFFSTATGWGLYTQEITNERAEFTLGLRYGSLLLRQLLLPLVNMKGRRVEVTLDDKKIKARIAREESKLNVSLDSVLIERDKILKIVLESSARL